MDDALIALGSLALLAACVGLPLGLYLLVDSRAREAGQRRRERLRDAAWRRLQQDAEMIRRDGGW